MQKSSGAFELAIWDENVKGTDNITVDLGGPHAKVNIYDVTIGTAPTQTLVNASSVPLALSDHALILEIVDCSADLATRSVMQAAAGRWDQQAN